MSMTSGSDQARAPLPPQQARVVKLSYAVVSMVLVALILGVGELYLLRAAGRADVRKLACFTVRYSPDSDPTAKEIRRAYGCPPARATPAAPAPLVTPGRASVASPPVTHPGRPTAAGTPVRLGPSRAPAPTAAPRRTAASSPSVSASPSASGLLGGLLCDLRYLPVCHR